MATIVLALVSSLLALVAPASAAGPVTVTPDVAALPPGALPALPYVDWTAREIVDGSKHVSIAGIAARVTALHKVDGGYLLVRRITDSSNDLVFVSTSGARRVLVPHWQGAGYYDALDPGLAVSHNGDKVLVNTLKPVQGGFEYADTRVLSLPGGKLLRKRDFGTYATLLAFGVDRAIVTVNGNTRWWNPARNTVTNLRTAAHGESADLTAWQWAVRTSSGSDGYFVTGIPPRNPSRWSITQEDESIGPWSPDDTKVVGINEVTDDFREGTSYAVFDAGDGAVPVRIHGDFPPRITWESDSTLLFPVRVDDAEPINYQLVRCTLAGVCDKVGPSTTERDGAIIPATRRNS